jgi:hypothetical protein
MAQQNMVKVMQLSKSKEDVQFRIEEAITAGEQITRNGREVIDQFSVQVAKASAALGASSGMAMVASNRTFHDSVEARRAATPSTDEIPEVVNPMSAGCSNVLHQSSERRLHIADAVSWSERCEEMKRRQEQFVAALVRFKGNADGSLEEEVDFGVLSANEGATTTKSGKFVAQKMITGRPAHAAHGLAEYMGISQQQEGEIKLRGLKAIREEFMALKNSGGARHRNHAIHTG